MRYLFVFLSTIAASLCLGLPAWAAPDLTQWFLRATAYQSVKHYTAMAKPDFMGGNSLKTMECSGWNGAGPHPVMFNGVWQLLKYDRAHHIALAAGSTDQCSAALFIASRPPVALNDADLATYGTGRGLHIGSSYAQVLSTYGGRREKHAAHFVLGYSATAHGHAVTIGHPVVDLPETITLVLDNDRVSSISIYIDEGGLF